MAVSASFRSAIEAFFGMNSRHANLAILLDDSNLQLNVSTIVGNTSNIVSSFLDGVGVNTNTGVFRQRDGDVLALGGRTSFASPIRNVANGGHGHIHNRYTVSRIRNTTSCNGKIKGLSRRSTCAFQFVYLRNGNGGIIIISLAFSHRDGGHAQQHHDCQQHCQNLLHGFILLKIEFVILWNRPGAARRRYSLGFWGHRPGPGFTGPFCAGW